MSESNDQEVVLSPKQQAFVEEYLIDFNAASAARRAGYSPTSAKESGYRNLETPHVKAAVDAAILARSQRTQVTADNVLAEFAKIGFFDIRSMFDDNGRLKPIGSLSAREGGAICSVEVVTKVLPGADGTPADIEYTHKIKLWDKVAALTQCGRHLGMFKDQIEHKGAVTFVIER
jgi:phage terminase small subunit